MKIPSQRGFTLVEIMVVLLIIGILATALFLAVGPYMMRSRDTKRITDILGYTNILDTYDKNFDTFPSNMGSGGNLIVPGYCLSEMYTRGDLPLPIPNEGKFSALGGSAGTAAPPQDPIQDTITIPVPLLCDIPGSYVYSRMKYGTNNQSQIAIIAARLEIRNSANYGTGADLIDVSRVQDIIDAKKSTVPAGAPDQLYVVYKLH